MRTKSNPQPLSKQQQQRLQSFIYSEPPITLTRFSSKWQVSRELIAEICRCDVRTIYRWFQQDRNYESLMHYHKWYLALAELVIEHFDELPETLKKLLCPDLNQ